MKEKDYTKWTRKEFESLPRPKSYNNIEIGVVDSLVIIPTKHIHDSGYRCMKFATIQNGIPTYLVSGSSDVLHLSGIGGENVESISEKFIERVRTKTIPICRWRVDCLPTSGLLRLFCDTKIKVGASLSSFEIYFVED